MTAQQPVFEWANSYQGDDGANCYSIAADSLGNVYNVGSFNGTYDFDPGPGTMELTSNGNLDIFITKTDVIGNLVWAKSIGSTSADEAYAVIADSVGNVYLTGYFYDFMDFDPGVGVYLLPSNGHKDIFLIKLDTLGVFEWGFNLGANLQDEGHGLTFDPSGNILVTGNFDSTVDFNPGTGTLNLTSSGSNDGFVMMCDSYGNYVWAKSFGGTSNEFCESIKSDGSGNIYISGRASGTIDFDPGTSTYNLTSSGGYDGFVLKLTSTGNFTWAKLFGGTGGEICNDVAVDQNGNVYTTGNFEGTVDFNPGTGTYNLTANGASDIFILKVDSAGNFQWAHSFGINNNYVESGMSLCVDANNYIYATGYFFGTVDFDPGSGVMELSAGYYDPDAYILKLDASGAFVWAFDIGGTNDDEGHALCMDSDNSIYLGGKFYGTSDFDPNFLTYEMTSSGSYDIFVVKLYQTEYPVSIFGSSADGINLGDSIHFTDHSINSPTTWNWDFGDGEGDTVKNPSHLYTSTGAYNVSLTVSNGTQSHTLTRDSLVIVLRNPNPIQWVKNMGGTNDDIVRSMAVDSSGNIYTTGYLLGTADFDPGPQTYTIGGSYRSRFFSGLDENGDFIWASGPASSNYNSYVEGSCIEVGSDNNVYVTGTSYSSTYYSQIFFRKLDSNGSIILSKGIGQYESDYGKAISVNNQGQIFITGRFEDDVNFGGNYPNYYIISSALWGSAYIASYDSVGDVEWAYEYGSSVYPAMQMATDGQGNVYSIGRFSSSYDFEPGNGSTVLTQSGGTNTYIVKFTPSGNFVWARSIGDGGGVEAKSISFDTFGDILMAGSFEDEPDFDPGFNVYRLKSNGETDMFVCKLDTAGDFIWAKGIGGYSYDSGNSVTSGINGDIYATGSYRYEADFFSGKGKYVLTSNGTFDAFVVKLDQNGNLIWVTGFGGTDSDAGNAIRVNSQGDLYCAGSFTGLVDFDSGSGVTYAGSNGGIDIFVAKFSEPEQINSILSASDTIPTIYEDISFFDLSTGNPSSWLWDFGDGTTSNLQAPTHSYQDTGIYTVSLSVMNIYGSDSETITEYIKVVNELIVDQTSDNITCHGLANGSINLTLLNGTSPYSYTWSNGETSEDISNLSGGTYSVSVIDQNNISFSDTFEIIEPLAISWTDSVYEDICQGTNGFVNVSLSGGTPPYLFTWSNGESTEQIDSLSGGVYMVTLMDTNQCTEMDTFELVQPVIPFTVESISNNITCYSFADGSIDLTISGGLPDTVNILWSNGAVTEDLNNLDAGIYTVTVTQDTFQCSEIVSIEITEPDSLELGFTTQAVDCHGNSTGKIFLDINGGTMPYSLNWSTGASASNLTNIPAGIYTLTVFDVNGCTNSIEITLTEPPVLSASAIVTDVIGVGNANGAIQSFPTGGTPPYQYSWNTGASTSSLVNIMAGNYSLIITDGNQCTWDSTFVVSELIGIENVAHLSAIKIYPNPANDKLYIALGSFGTKSECDSKSRPNWLPRIELINTAGQVILEKEIGNHSKLELDLHNFPAGEYFVRLIEEGRQVFVEKVVKE